MSWKPWKSLEKEVAEFFGGVRKIRYQFDEFCGDILHPALAIECKYGKQIPKYLHLEKGHAKLIRLPQIKPIIVLDSKTLTSTLDYELDHLERKEALFLTDGLTQALGYPGCQEKVPMLCFKPPRHHGFVVAMLHQDYLRLIRTPLSSGKEVSLKPPPSWASEQQQEQNSESQMWRLSNHIEPRSDQDQKDQEPPRT